VLGISAAIVVTGGAVAAVVGTNPGADRAASPTTRPAAVIASDEPAPRSSSSSSTSTGDAASPDAPVAPATDTPSKTGYSSDHSSHTLDPATGVLLTTDTHTTHFARSKEHRVTVTVENTGEYPVVFSAEQGCGLQVVATAGSEVPALPDGTISDDTPWFEWECAANEGEPRLVAPTETWVLAPGDSKTADATLVLDQAGGWNISGVCRCTYRQVKPTPVPKGGPLVDLTKGTLSVPLADESPDGSNLITPPIGVKVD
jgi:hypothetical protein